MARFTRDEWQEEVRAGKTYLGYLAWLSAKEDEDKEDRKEE